MSSSVDFPEASELILVQDPLYTIRSQGRVVWCEVSIARNVDPASGASAGERMTDFLLEHVLTRRSRWLGTIVDVRRGPSVFGPRTLVAVERMFGGAEQARRRIAALVGTAPTQQAQFTSVAAAHSPTMGRVTEDVAVAKEWVTRGA